MESVDANAQWLKDLAAWVESEEARARKEVAWAEDDLENWSSWLLGLTYFDKRAGVWRSLAMHILAQPERSHPAAARAALQHLGDLVAAHKAID